MKVRYDNLCTLQSSSFIFALHFTKNFVVYYLLYISSTTGRSNQKYTPGTKYPKFQSTFNEDKQEIIDFIKKQLNTYLVRDDYKELGQVSNSCKLYDLI